jgi:glycosyltransferase involved in cell wall biosynthesis
MNRVPLSVIIPVKNEAENLRRCLASVAWADDIWLVDSHSTDATAEIAAACSARVVQFDFNGTWPKKKNWALENLPFKHDWVLLLDADETLPAGAEAEIGAIVSTPGGPDGYWINRRFNFLGQWLRHAYYPNWNLRLFRHRLGRFEQLTDVATESGDVEVHEHVVVQGSAGRLRSEMDHYAFPTVAAFIEKHNRYSNWEARVALEGAHGRATPRHARAGLRRWLRRLSLALPGRPFLRFLYVYVWQRGFLDGRAGYYFARLHAVYEFLCVAKTYELRLRRK